MFGRTQNEKEQAEQKQRFKREHEEGRRELWKIIFEQAKGDEHKMTQAEIKYDLELRSDYFREWLEDFDRRVASEIREQAKLTRSYITIAFAALLLVILYYQH